MATRDVRVREHDVAVAAAPDERAAGRDDVAAPLGDEQRARLSRQGAILVIEALGSTNGTYLNDELLRGPRPLHAGDRVRIGASTFTYDD